MHPDRLGGGVFLHAPVRERRQDIDLPAAATAEHPAMLCCRRPAIGGRRRLSAALASGTQSFTDEGAELVERERLAEKSICA